MDIKNIAIGALSVRNFGLRLVGFYHLKPLESEWRFLVKATRKAHSKPFESEWRFLVNFVTSSGLSVVIALRPHVFVVEGQHKPLAKQERSDGAIRIV